MLPPPASTNPIYLQHYSVMVQALALAEAAGQAGEVPVGAIILNAQGDAIATGENRRERDHDPTAHAEIVALRQAARHQRDWQLTGCRLYVTLEPCPMCAAAILQARIKTLIYATDDPKAGAIRSVLTLPTSPASFHRLEVLSGILAGPAQTQLQAWFAQRRNQSSKHDAKPKPSPPNGATPTGQPEWGNLNGAT